jgi:two-component system, NarL family, nitrate/nitrite response regulator NarL
MLSILIVSEIRLYREGLADLLARQGSLRVVGTAEQADEALSLACEHHPCVVLIDKALPGGLSLSRKLLELEPDVRVVALGVPDDAESVLCVAEAGIVGYVPRDATVADLVGTVERAVRGELQCSPQLAGAIVRRLAMRATVGDESNRGPLTARESEILRLIDEGLSNKEIAVRLGIEVATVKNHVHNLLEKLRVHRRAEAAAHLRARDPRLTARREAAR